MDAGSPPLRIKVGKHAPRPADSRAFSTARRRPQHSPAGATRTNNSTMIRSRCANTDDMWRMHRSLWALQDKAAERRTVPAFEKAEGFFCSRSSGEVMTEPAGRVRHGGPHSDCVIMGLTARHRKTKMGRIAPMIPFCLRSRGSDERRARSGLGSAPVMGHPGQASWVFHHWDRCAQGGGGAQFICDGG